jgi:hypothetical protein
MNVFGELIRAQIENLAADPTGGGLTPKGRIWIRTDTNELKYSNATVAKTVLDTDSSQTVQNKDIDGGTASNTSRLTVPKGTTSVLDALTDKEATVAYDTTKSLLVVNDGAAWSDVGSGSGSGSLYTIGQDDFEFDITGVSTTDAVNLAITHETTSPIAGAGSLKIAKAASNENGEYVTLAAFTIDDDLQAQVITVRFTSTQTANYVDEYMVPVAYDVENAVEIPIIPEGVLAGTGEFRGTFQTAVKGGGGSEGQYQIRLKVDTTTTTAWDFFVDRFDVSKIDAPTGLPGWRQYDVSGQFTGLGNFAVNAAVATPYKTINGDWRMAFNASMQTGSSSGQEVSSLTLTFTGVTFKAGMSRQALACQLFDQGVAARTSNQAYANAGSGTLFFQAESAANFDLVTFSGDVALDSLPTWAVDLGPNILGEDADTRTISVDVEKKTTAQTVPSNSWTQITFNTENDDSHSAFASNVFTAPITTNYYVSYGIALFTSGTAPSFVITGLSIDGANDPQLFRHDSSDIVTNEAKYYKGSGTIKLNKGQTLQLRAFSSGQTIDAVANNDTRRSCYITVASVGSPQQIAATESVYFQAYESTDTTIADGQTTPTFDTVEVDSHNAWNGTDTYTCPVSGIYRAKIQTTLNDANWDSTHFYRNGIRKNGTVVKINSKYGKGTAGFESVDCSALISCNKGDTISGYERIDDATDAPYARVASSSYTWFSVEKIN